MEKSKLAKNRRRSRTSDWRDKKKIKKQANTEELLIIFKDSLQQSMDKNIPSKQIKSNIKLPWFNKKIKRMLKKNKASMIRPKEQKSGQTTDSSKKNAENKYGKKNETT